MRQRWAVVVGTCYLASVRRCSLGRIVVVSEIDEKRSGVEVPELDEGSCGLRLLGGNTAVRHELVDAGEVLERSVLAKISNYPCLAFVIVVKGAGAGQRKADESAEEGILSRS